MKYKLTKKQKKMLTRIIIAVVLLAVIAVTLHFVEVPWWAELILYAVPYAIAGYDVLKTAQSRDMMSSRLHLSTLSTARSLMRSSS